MNLWSSLAFQIRVDINLALIPKICASCCIEQRSFVDFVDKDGFTFFSYSVCISECYYVFAYPNSISKSRSSHPIESGTCMDLQHWFFK